MKRNLKTEGIVIRNYRVQDYHKGTVIFSPEAGILHAIAYGGYKGKSRLGPAVQPLNRGIFDIYRDPVKKSARINEYEPAEVYQAVKDNLKKYFTALAWLETASKAHGGGESSGELYSLLCDCLDLLLRLPENLTDRIMVQFLARALVIFGENMDSSDCSICGRKTGEKEQVYFSLKDAGFACVSCSTPQMIQVSPGAKRYLEYSLKNDLIHSINAGIDDNLLKHLKSLLYSIIQEYLEDTLSTLRTGKDFLI